MPFSLLAQQAGRACPDPESGGLTDGPRDRAGGPNHSKGTSEQKSLKAAEFQCQQGAGTDGGGQPRLSLLCTTALCSLPPLT